MEPESIRCGQLWRLRPAVDVFCGAEKRRTARNAVSALNLDHFEDFGAARGGLALAGQDSDLALLPFWSGAFRPMDATAHDRRRNRREAELHGEGDSHLPAAQAVAGRRV